MFINPIADLLNYNNNYVDKYHLWSASVKYWHGDFNQRNNEVLKVLKKFKQEYKLEFIEDSFCILSESLATSSSRSHSTKNKTIVINRTLYCGSRLQWSRRRSSWELTMRRCCFTIWFKKMYKTTGSNDTPLGRQKQNSQLSDHH
jgi:hypothetical protein